MPRLGEVNHQISYGDQRMQVRSQEDSTGAVLSRGTLEIGLLGAIGYAVDESAAAKAFLKEEQEGK